MKRAINNTLKHFSSNNSSLSLPQVFCLIDGNQKLNINYPQIPIIKGDHLIFSIAAASIVAKVNRDRLMAIYDKKYPGYGFTQHKGYATSQHLNALYHLGPCPIHRQTFSPVIAAAKKFSTASSGAF